MTHHIIIELTIGFINQLPEDKTKTDGISVEDIITQLI